MIVSVYLEPLVNAFLVELMITWSESPDPLPHLEITHTHHTTRERGRDGGREKRGRGGREGERERRERV